ncbi:3-oxo-tetronate kinase [Bradyrhizobium sp. GCM10027634]|uniref:3-oxo-tetronate kinase n=1 Tax=unclassified Bradyrhizobium TaxID=2631580 RepID=UPI0018C0DC76|nr:MULTISPECIES: 3-oxo-tetronate kinase [unclassified Bradyrhizobium]MDN5005733.1 four-carbon acid sugar kinase family protein [Bradyrhizobium sp. WYCCWR 12677]QOZ44497.1 four-carbon acid sugar kinase family protein [Bradyrhizobium sp. CCBAU 53340]
MTTLIFGVVADDLTGGMETAAMLVAAGIECGFVTDPDLVGSCGDVPAIVIAQKTRVIPAGEAVCMTERAARALLARDVRQVFFKYCATFDSTDQGNIGPVSDLLMRLTGAEYTVFCPASPTLRRTVYNGHLFLGTELISDSPKRNDPLTPMTDPDLVRVLQRQTRTRVGLLAHSLVSAGSDPAGRAIGEAAARGIRYFIADAIYDRDLDTLAALTCDWKLMTGNATIVQHYPDIWKARGLIPAVRRPPGLRAVGGGGVVLAGSCAERTLEQLAEFEKSHPVLRIDLLNAGDVAATIGDALDWARPRLDDGPVGFATSEVPEAVKIAQERYGREGAARLAETILGRLAVALREIGVRRFVVTGGETSGAIVEQLGIRRLRVGPYGGPGIGIAVTEDDDPLALCLKSGKLGPVDLFATTLEAMLNPEGVK